jgi:activator of 2-hydroxyglutaryl-CoA dehydratase
MQYALGIDLGSSFAKAAVFGEGTLLSYAVMPSGGNFAATARKVAMSAAEKAAVSDKDLSITIATGWGAAASHAMRRGFIISSPRHGPLLI